MQLRVIGVLFFILFQILYPKTIIGIGRGKTEIIAKKKALKDLSDNIAVDIVSKTKSVIKVSDENVKKEGEEVVSTFSNQFLLGVKYQVDKEKEEYEVKAILDDESFKIYENRKNYLISEIKELYSKNSDKEYYLNNLIEIEKKLKEINKIESLLLLAGKNKGEETNIRLEAIRREIQSLKKELRRKKAIFFKLNGGINKNVESSLRSGLKQFLDKDKYVILQNENESSFIISINFEKFIEKIIPKTVIKPERYEIDCAVLVEVYDKEKKESRKGNFSKNIIDYSEKSVKETVMKEIIKFIEKEIKRM